jgi:hypothetical protein
VRTRIETVDRVTRVRTLLDDGSPTLDLSFSLEEEAATPPTGSPFPDWHAARRFAGPMPFTFDAESDNSFVIIEGSRQDWVPRPIVVKDWQVALFDDEPLRGTRPILANAFTTQNVAYRWKRGRVVHIGGPE